MEVATTNNHHHHHHPHQQHSSQSTLHQHHHHRTHQTSLPTPLSLTLQRTPQQQTHSHTSSLDADAAADSNTIASGNAGNSSPRSPFQREVREWQRIDPDTGALLSGRLEADRWINGPLNSYGKISDSQNISQPNGTQHTQRKQLEVLQARTTNGAAMQVIRTQTVQTTSSRSWSSNTSNSNSASASASTSASASASASPICVGKQPQLHHSQQHHKHQQQQHAHNNQSHFHKTLQQHLAETNTHWLQLPPPARAATVDISEMSTEDDDDDHYDDHDDRFDVNAAYQVDDAATAAVGVAQQRHYSINASKSKHQSLNHNNHNNNNSRISNINGGSSGKRDRSRANNCNTTSVAASLLLLPDTAPSLKLSNLMKSNSGLSSNSSSSSLSGGSSNMTTTTQTTTTTAHTHNSAGKISLHAIVGNNSDNNNDSNSETKLPATRLDASASAPGTTTAATGTTTWQQQHQHQHQQQRNSRLFEQASLYGNSNNSALKSRVGVADCDDCATAAAIDAHDLLPLPLRQAMTPTQRRRDLESFRHYALPTAASKLAAKAGAAAAVDDDDNDDDADDGDGDVVAATATCASADADADDDLRLSTRQLRRQQLPFITSQTLLQRSRSISNDDLSSDWSTQYAGAHNTTDNTATGVADDDAPSDWRRVSKLRRSFQSTSSNTNSANANNDTYARHASTARSRSRPRPGDTHTSHSGVSVAQIRAELEAGRRLNTAMRNNHVDLAALDNILHSAAGSSNATSAHKYDGVSKRDSFLTAASLQEIRGKLKKLSDESLYKDDFIVYQQPPVADEQIEVQQSVRKLPTGTASGTAHRLHQLTPEATTERPTTPKSAFQAVGQRQHANASPTSSFLAQRAAHISPKHATHSLESRQKFKDTNSTEWHLRRKSYGFEKMSPPEGKTMYRMDASTDSGLGRSGEQLGNWSPTEPAAASSARATVIHFGATPSSGEVARGATTTSAGYRAGKSPTRMQRISAAMTPADDDDTRQKRHSIAVDESQYVRDNLRKTSQVRLNGFYDASGAEQQCSKSLQLYEGASTSSNTSALYQRSQQQKRVEFCKTEVHFAAESGRVNIVETDGKPPPTNNFRRRRRTTSGPLQSLIKTTATSAASTAATQPGSVTHFGDDLHQRHRTIASSVVAYKATLVEATETASEPATNVTVSIPKLAEHHLEGSRSSYASTTSGVDTTDNENDEIAAIRGILKNKPVKPKPYHLGENIDSADALWGVQLKPVAGASTLPTGRRDHDGSPTSKSVAERVRIVEKRQDHGNANGYSTKINLSMDDAARDWSEGALHSLTPKITTTISSNNRRPSAQELLLQDLREHQRILDEGLKSTSLIIKTMRSANEFDEAMRRLSIASLEATVVPTIVVPTPMLRSNNYQETLMATSTMRRYSQNSVEGSGERELVTSYSANSTALMNRRLSSETNSAFTTQLRPLAAPRLKMLGNTEMSTTQQLPQLRCLNNDTTTYCAAQENADDGLDSADEEVKSYFCGRNNEHQSDSGGGTLESSSQEDERAAEYSSSWSRLKAKRIVWKIEAEEREAKHTFLDRADVPKSNVMSIELHSPQAALEKRSSFKRAQSPPIAKPRTVANIKSGEQPQIHTATTVKQNTERYPSAAESIRNSLKIVKEARGARKLREHELSYFGVGSAKLSDEPISKYPPTTTNVVSITKRTLPSRKLHDEAPSATETKSATEGKAQTTTKWQLLNDKPDLLRHSPIAVEPQMIRRTAELQARGRADEHKNSNAAVDADNDEDDDDDDDDDEEHYYENITNEITPIFKVKPPPTTHRYDRRRDLERDALILSEMNKSADQTLKALSDEAALKDQRRRSLHRRNSKPLETIDEKTIAEKINDTCIAVKMARSTYASDAKRTPRHATPSPTNRVRTSSQSSVESCPRARSRSLSSEREYENINSTPKPTRSVSASASATRSATKSSRSGQQQQRSSSRESQRSARMQYSSGDEVGKRDEQQQRLRTKSKRPSGSGGGSTSRSADKHSKESLERREHRQQHHHHHQQQQQHTSKERERDRERHAHTASGTAHASQREERVECTSAPSHGHAHAQQQSRTSSGRRRREELTHTSGSLRHTSTRTANASEKPEKPEKKHERTGSAGARLLRSLRGHEHDTTTHQRTHSQRSSAGEREKTEREREREREKDKQSRTRGHSSRTSNNNSSNTSKMTTLTQSGEERATMATPMTASQRYRSTATPPKAHTREHKKSITTTTTTTTTVGNKTRTPTHEAHATHSKNTQNVNTSRRTAHDDGQQRRQQRDHEQRGQLHHHQMSTSASATKKRERSAK